MNSLVKEYFIDSKLFEALRKVIEKTKIESYLIGGAVRDILLSKKQPKDIDIVSVGSGIEIAKALKKELSNSSKIQIFKNYGTAMFTWNKIVLEFVGARKESYVKESRNPSIEIGSLDDDQNRRDFTINSIAISLNSSNYGELIDPLNGLNDLKKRILRTPLDPNKTFSDAPLRMMRAIRFASQLNFTIEKKSM